MNRVAAIAGSAIFLVIAPGTVAVLIPRRIYHWQMAPPLLGFVPFRVLGVLLICAGLPVLLDSFARFAVVGLGTPAPVAPPKHLVVSGLYRHVRNPMYVAVLSLVLGQGLLFGSVRVLEYGAALFVIVHLFVLLYEEPALQRKFGSKYDDYRKNVKRWWPRVRGWIGDS